MATSLDKRMEPGQPPVVEERIDMLNVLTQELVVLYNDKNEADKVAAQKLILCAKKLVEIALCKLARLPPGLNEKADQIAESLIQSDIVQDIKNGDVRVGLGSIAWIVIEEPFVCALKKYKG